MLEHIAQLLLPPAPPRLGGVAQRVHEVARALAHRLLTPPHIVHQRVEAAVAFASFGLDLGNRILIGLEPVVDGRDQRLQLLARCRFRRGEAFASLV